MKLKQGIPGRFLLPPLPREGSMLDMKDPKWIKNLWNFLLFGCKIEGDIALIGGCKFAYEIFCEILSFETCVAKKILNILFSNSLGLFTDFGSIRKLIIYANEEKLETKIIP